jgi:hypothetical protein
MEFDGVEEGSRILYRRRYSIRVVEDRLIERSPSGEYLKFDLMGWINRADLKHHELLEILGAGSSEEMCPNCVTPWKCNGPHSLSCRNAPGGSPQLEQYIDALELSGHDADSDI